MKRRVAALGLAAAVFGGTAQAGQLPGVAPPVQAERLVAGEAVRVDGRLDEAVWSRAQPLDQFFEIDPGDRLPPKLRTEVRFAFDAQALYVAVRAYDPDPAGLRAPITRRDGSGDENDSVMLYLDPVGTRRYAQFFDITPAGMITDGLFSETSGGADQSDAQIGVEDRSPNYRFTRAVGRFDGGWTIELAIPFSTLRHDGGTRPWAVLVARNLPREQAYYFLSAAKPHDAACQLCFAADLVGIDGVSDASTVDGAITLSHRRASAQQGDEASQHSQATRIGADVKLRPRPDTVLDATLRPDFSQVEIDAPQLSGNTRYAIYFPEKRPFFLEGVDILESPMPVLRTRSIAAPDWGLRLTRRNETMDGTVILAHDSAVGDVLLPGAGFTDTRERNEPSLALLARGRLHLGAGTAGLVYSERRYRGALGGQRVGGVDFAAQPSSQDRVDLQALWSEASALQAERGAPAHGGAVQGRWYHRGPAFNVDFSLRQIDRGFRADNGFIEEAGVRRTALNLVHYRRPYLGLQEAGLYADGLLTQVPAGPVLRQRAALGGYLLLPMLTKLWFAPAVALRQRADTESAARRWTQWQLGVQSVPSSWLTGVYVEYTGGRQFDLQRQRVGSGHELHTWAKWQLLDPLQVQWSADRQAIEGDGAVRWFSERTQRWLVLWHLTPDQYLRLIDQRRRLRRDDGAADDEQALTLSWQHQLDASVLLDAGFSRRRFTALQADARQRGNEAFVKLNVAFER